MAPASPPVPAHTIALPNDNSTTNIGDPYLPPPGPSRLLALAGEVRTMIWQGWVDIRDLEVRAELAERDTVARRIHLWTETNGSQHSLGLLAVNKQIRQEVRPLMGPTFWPHTAQSNRTGKIAPFYQLQPKPPLERVTRLEVAITDVKLDREIAYYLGLCSPALKELTVIGRISDKAKKLQYHPQGDTTPQNVLLWKPASLQAHLEQPEAKKAFIDHLKEWLVSDIRHSWDQCTLHWNRRFLTPKVVMKVNLGTMPSVRPMFVRSCFRS
jgi:hypothetical protein